MRLLFKSVTKNTGYDFIGPINGSVFKIGRRNKLILTDQKKIANNSKYK